MASIIKGFPKGLNNLEHQVFVMRYLDDKRINEISNELNFTQQYIRLINSHILDKFNNYLKLNQLK